MMFPRHMAAAMMQAEAETLARTLRTMPDDAIETLGPEIFNEHGALLVQPTGTWGPDHSLTVYDVTGQGGTFLDAVRQWVDCALRQRREIKQALPVN